MDASKIISTKGDADRNISDRQAVRIALAASLRDLADEIENGTRAIAELQTFEQAQGETNAVSILHMVTSLLRKPIK